MAQFCLENLNSGLRYIILASCTQILALETHILTLETQILTFGTQILATETQLLDAETQILDSETQILFILNLTNKILKQGMGTVYHILHFVTFPCY